MQPIRPAQPKDISRIAEILIFSKRTHYRSIFHNDPVSFNLLQVLPLTRELEETPGLLESYWVYDDGIVKGLIHMEGREIKELYVEPFFEGTGVGSSLIRFAIEQHAANRLWVLEKNEAAIRFYQRHGFAFSGEQLPEEGTPEFIVQMVR